MIDYEEELKKFEPCLMLQMQRAQSMTESLRISWMFFRKY